MQTRILRSILLAGAAIAVASARADQIPAPTGALRDFEAIGIIQIEFPATPAKAGAAEDKKDECEKKAVPAEPPVEKKGEPLGKTVIPGTFMMFDFYQGFVRPDCYKMETSYLGAREICRGLANTERTYTPGSAYVVDRSYKNQPTPDSPMRVARNSMATYARVFGELTTGKLLPAEDTEALKKQLTAREVELRELRSKLMGSTNPDDLPLATAAAAEHARVRDELVQLPLRARHPCHVVKFENKAALEALLAKGLLSGFPADTLDRGSTTVWLTKEEGLPIKIEVTANDGRLALFVILKDFRINNGLKASDLSLPIPLDARLITVSADLRDPEWEVAMERELSIRINRFEEQRQKEKQAEKLVRPRK